MQIFYDQINRYSVVCALYINKNAPSVLKTSPASMLIFYFLFLIQPSFARSLSTASVSLKCLQPQSLATWVNRQLVADSLVETARTSKTCPDAYKPNLQLW